MLEANLIIAWIKRHGIAIIIFALIATIAMYPVVPAMHQDVLGSGTDSVGFIYLIGRVTRNLVSGSSPFIDPIANFPGSLDLTATDAPFLEIIAFIPFTLIANEIFTYNLLLFLSYVLSGFFTYLWIHRLTGSRLAGIVAGTIFALTPYRVVRSYGHLNLLGTQFIPLFFWSLDCALQSEKPSPRGLVLLGTTTFLVGTVSQYYLVICLFTGILYALFTNPSVNYLIKQGWKFIFPTLAGALLSSAQYLVSRADDLYRPTDTPIRAGSISIVDFFIPSPLHPFWGAMIREKYQTTNRIEYTVYLSLAALALAVLAFLWRESPYKQRNLVWLGTALVGLIMALGTDLHIAGGKPLQPDNPIWLPAYYIGQLPLFNILRAWNRFSIITIYFTAMLAGMGIVTLEEKYRLRKPAAAIILALIFIDLLPGQLNSFTLKPRPVDLWLAEQPGDFSVGFIPPGHGFNYDNLYGSLFHGKRITAYAHPTHQPEAFRRFDKRLTNFPEISSLKAIRQLNLDYIILLKNYFDGEEHTSWEEVETSLNHFPRATFVAEIDGLVIYKLK